MVYVFIYFVINSNLFLSVATISGEIKIVTAHVIMRIVKSSCFYYYSRNNRKKEYYY